MKKMLSLLFIVTMIASTSAIAQENPSKDAEVSDKVAAERSDDVKKWEDVESSKKKKKPNKLYQEPFGPIETPPAGDGVEIDNQPQDENYDSSPFDRN